jgi:hypothetical protein
LSKVPVPLQAERLRRATSRFGTARTIAFGALGLFLIHLVVPLPIPLANLLLPSVSVLMTLYSASQLHSALSCPECGALTRLDHYWVCGFCTFEHKTQHVLFGHTFVETCARPLCGRKQYSFICWNCRQPIIFDKQAFRYDEEKSAFYPDYPSVAPTPAPVEERPPKLYDEDLR